ncbi:helix-turn-helix domain-containing protein [Fusibacter tunisiensis]|uniref:Transcriptional regulator n=1 Tax=Fusibacter tunisiensis TaxID=1008308 RepID=A0ABS2MSX9_9FIRM|nr:helix-turn-helix domain-containing protein [Fusibacter tunisiensis]MBM7562504.1 putative transcriptional regulator [Fusibacter tunisiensis]
MTDKGKMIEAVYKAHLSKRATLVIFYLINRANKDLTCFPGIKTIASDCNMSDRTVRRALDDLVKSGFVKKDARYRENGGQSSNLYTLMLEIEVEVKEKEDEMNIPLNDPQKISRASQPVENIDFLDIISEPTFGKQKSDEIEDEEIELKQLQKRQVRFNGIISKPPSASCNIELYTDRIDSNFLCQGEADSMIPP